MPRRTRKCQIFFTRLIGLSDKLPAVEIFLVRVTSLLLLLFAIVKILRFEFGY